MITQRFMQLTDADKPDALKAVLSAAPRDDKVLVFCNRRVWKVGEEYGARHASAGCTAYGPRRELGPEP